MQTKKSVLILILLLLIQAVLFGQTKGIGHESNNDKFSRITISSTFGYAVPELNNDWVDENEGLAIKYGLGGNLSLNWPLTRWLSIGPQVSYGDWRSQKNFNRGGETVFIENQSLQTLSAELSMELFLFRLLSMQAHGGYTGLLINQTYSEGHPSPNQPTNIITFRPTFGISIGPEISLSKFIMKPSVGYNSVINENLRLISGDFRTINVQLSLGFKF